MFEFLGGLVTSILGGGVTGILGVAVQRIADYKNKRLDLELSKQKFDHEIAMRRADAEIMAQEWAARTKVAEVEAAGKEAVADSQAFAASFNLEPQQYASGASMSPGQAWLMVILDFVRGIVRPSLTMYLCVLTTLVYIEARRTLGGTAVTSQEALELMKMVVGTILYLATTCVLWYFGTRNKQAPPKR